MEDISARTKDYLDTYLLGELTGNASIICIQMQTNRQRLVKYMKKESPLPIYSTAPGPI